MWDSRLIDFFVAGLQRDEKLVEVSGFVLKTNQRSFTRAELKRACRMNVEIDDAAFQKNFTNDDEVHAAEARLAQREPPPVYGRQLSYPGGIRPGR